MSEPFNEARNLKLPLAGKKIVVTRSKEQAGGFSANLSSLGAEVIEFPVIKFISPPDTTILDTAVAELDSYEWVIFTSVNGVEFFWKRVEAAGKGAATFAGVKVCAVGPATARSLRARGVEPSLIPGKHMAEGILAEFGEDLVGKRFLLPTADIARETLVDGLESRGGLVNRATTYHTVPCDNEEPGSISATQMVEWLEKGEIDLISFTSPSTIKNFAARLKTASPKPINELLTNCLVACIGPVSAGTAREMGLRVGLEASEFTIDNLVTTITNHFNIEEVTLDGR